MTNDEGVREFALRSNKGVRGKVKQRKRKINFVFILPIVSVGFVF